MTTNAVIQLRNRDYLVNSGQSLEQALKALGIDPESVLAIREGIIIGYKEVILPQDNIRLIYVISGGIIE